MNPFERWVLPHAVNYTCSRRPQMRQRRKIVPEAGGVVLELGFGTGLNLSCYDPERVERVLALEPSDAMWALAEPRVAASSLRVERLAESAERLPLGPASIDSAVVTYTLCTIPDVIAALAAVRSALRPGAGLLFCEHGAAPDAGVRRWQDRLDPVWGVFAGGCHINREIPHLIESAGFRFDRLESMYLPGWRPVSWNCWGRATPA